MRAQRSDGRASLAARSIIVWMVVLLLRPIGAADAVSVWTRHGGRCSRVEWASGVPWRHHREALWPRADDTERFRYTGVSVNDPDSLMPWTISEAPGVSVFLKDGGQIYHTYSTYTRGLDMLNVAYHYGQ